MTEPLYSKIIGDGTPLLILHGFLGMSDNWKTLGSAYAENGFEVHLIDQRNHGRSFHSEAFDYDILSEDLLRYTDTHQLKNFSLLGHSMGGKTAMTFATSYPERVTHLLVADIAPKNYPPHHQQIINGLRAINLDQVKSRTDADHMLGEHISNAGIRQFLLKNLYRKEANSFAFRFNLEVLGNRMEEIGKALAPESTYGGKTLFLKGDRSDYITENDRELIHRHFPMAEIKEIPKSGHWLHAENPAAFLRESLSFLKTV